MRRLRQSFWFRRRHHCRRRPWNGREWAPEQDDLNLDTNQTNYTGLDASLLLLQQVWSSCPFWGLLGVGQGAAIASLLALSPHTYPPPAFAIFVSGFALLEETQRLVDTHSLPCLHLVDAADEAMVTDDEPIPKDDTRNSSSTNNNDNNNNNSTIHSNRLVQQFGGTVYRRKPRRRRRRDGSPSGPSFFDKDDLNAIGRFIMEQKKRLYASHHPNNLNDDDDDDDPHRRTTRQYAGEIVALQSALFAVEQRAADLLAQQIAANPPAPLMAVIRPQAVAGWIGNKRQVEGGGAPCPSEFLLNREKRANARSSQESREHPSQKSATTSS